MQYVRCEECGAKAILAASRCPKCTHPFHLRDHSGELVRLARCPTCGTYYPRSVGGCRWCGTKAPTFDPMPIVWGALAVAVAIGLTLAVRWTVGRGVSDAVPGSRRVTATAPVALPSPGLVTRPDSISGESAAVETIVSTDSASRMAARTDSVRREALSQPNVPAGASTSSATRAVRWSAARAITYANVRGEASREAAVVGVVTPGAKVELGDERAGWRRVRSAGILGWADPRNFRLDSLP